MRPRRQLAVAASTERPGIALSGVGGSQTASHLETAIGACELLQHEVKEARRKPGRLIPIGGAGLIVAYALRSRQG